MGEALGAKLQELRASANLSAREASRRLGLSTTRLRDFEMGKTHGRDQKAVPKRELLGKIAKLYDYPLDNLLRLAGYPADEPVAPEPPSEAELRAREIAQVYLDLPEPQRSLFLDVVQAFKRSTRQ